MSKTGLLILVLVTVAITATLLWASAELFEAIFSAVGPPI